MNKKIQEIRDRWAELIRYFPEHDIAYLLSEYDRLTTLIEAQDKVIDAYIRIESDMESDFVEVLERIGEELTDDPSPKAQEINKIIGEALSHIERTTPLRP